MNNEPESPKKIFPEKIFISQNPKIEDDINNAKVKNVSLNSKHNKPIAINDVIANPDASPFSPSIKFQAFITETIPNNTKQNEIYSFERALVKKRDSMPYKFISV